MKKIYEDGEGGVPANSVGGGGIEGIGIGPQGEPGVHKRNKKKIIMDTLRRVYLGNENGRKERRKR